MVYLVRLQMHLVAVNTDIVVVLSIIAINTAKADAMVNLKPDGKAFKFSIN